MFRFQVSVGDEWVGELTRDYYLHLGSVQISSVSILEFICVQVRL